MKKIIFLLLILGVMAAFLFGPIIPILKTPVIPEPVYTFTWDSIYRIYCPFLAGVQYQEEWYTYAVLLFIFCCLAYLVRWAIKSCSK